MDIQATKQISCKRCQKRKIRCSRTDPCINCSTAGVSCEFRSDGTRRLPISRTHVELLESRIAKLEGFLVRLKAAPPGSRDAMIEGINFQDHHVLSGQDDEGRTSTQPEYQDDREDAASMVQDAGKGSLSYHGPTSIYSGALAQSDLAAQSTNGLPLPLSYTLDSGERRINECIALFFHWQYPQFMFIDREAFMLDFQNGTFDSQFCSSALINAICAVGALMSTDLSTKACSGEFSEAASNVLLNKGLTEPHSSSVQALLCCAFYHIGRGDLSKGWLFSGLAFRMGQDLGFQRDPETWKSPVSSAVMEFKRRLYWGCYMSDKFISLILGRPSVMHIPDADVKPSQPLPQHQVFNTWIDQQPPEHNLTGLKDMLPIVPKLTLVFNKQIEIGAIIDEGLAVVYSPRKALSSAGTLMALDQVNAKLSRFKENLPAEMRLKEWSTLTEYVPNHVAVLQVLYHSVLISLNRPFLRTNGLGTSNSPDASSPKSICMESIERIQGVFSRFRFQHGLRHAPLAFVHGAIIAVNAILSLAHLDDQGLGKFTSTTLQKLQEFLQELSPTWALAESVHSRLQRMTKPSQQTTQPDDSLMPPFEYDLDIALDDPSWNFTFEDMRLGFLDENMILE